MSHQECRPLISLALISLLTSTLAAQRLDEFTRQASQLVKQNQWNEAAEILRKGMQSYPDNPELLLQMGNLLIHTGQAAQAEVVLREALAANKDNPEILRNLGEAEIRLGRLPAAVELFRKVLRRQSNDGQSHYRLAFTFYLQGDLQHALESARRAVEVSPMDANYREFYALILEQAGDTNESHEQLKAAHRLELKNAHLLFRLGEKERLDGQLSQAMESLEQAVRLDPENPLYHRQLARVYARLALLQQSSEEDARASRLLQAFQQYIQALTLAGRGQEVEALRRMEPLVTKHPEFTTGAMFLADLYRRRGQEKKALDLYLKVLERNPLDSRAIQESAWIEVRQGALTEAIELLRRIQEENPNEALIEGYRNLVQENWAGALREFRKVEAQLPLNAELLQLISFCLKAQGQRNEALSYLDKAIQLQPKDTRIQRQKHETKLANAFDLLEKRNWRAALRVFTELMAADGIEAGLYLNVAYCRQQSEDLQGAIRDYRIGLQGDPKAAWARTNLANLLFRLARYREAAAEWETVLAQARAVQFQHSGTDAVNLSQVYYCLGLCYSHLERFAQAEASFQNALRFGKETPELLYNLGVLRLRQNSPEEALNLIRRSARAGYEPAKRILEQAESHQSSVSGHRP
ncbi:MAG TPA: tetratricopeptide repeat protein [Acidobacteriota bacterium]|nr:tetratricopeptide repeat protein [Acidobacteriota bacterium]